MKLRIETYLRLYNPELKRTEIRQRQFSPHISETTYTSAEELRAETRRRFGGHSTIEDIPNGLKITPNPGTGSGEAYQILTLED